ncbi:integral membrane protein [Purpureocillium lilacinum]|uniref:Integral membrane protein n=1 Tax=Purpureocillium lilacinum TaxID=33203 RepID=A0A179GWK8_PURLI|nr:integral membrane protein [Purpureocillium lilacinum]
MRLSWAAEPHRLDDDSDDGDDAGYRCRSHYRCCDGRDGSGHDRHRQPPPLHEPCGGNAATLLPAGVAPSQLEKQERHQSLAGTHDVFKRRPGRRRGRRRTWADSLPSSLRPAPMTLLATMLLLVLFVASPADAVRVNVTNCLSEDYLSAASPRLQWEPLFAEAKFDTKNSTHNLQLTVWGNVTGKQYQDNLPPPDSEYWTNPDPANNNGKIVETVDGGKATTLVQRVNVLTYEPWNHLSSFCKDALINGSCPLSPVFHPKPEYPYGLPAINMSHDFHSEYTFASFAATMIIINGDTTALNIGCMSVTITPDLGGVAWVLKFLPLVILLFCGFAVVFAAIYSPWGTTNIFHWSSNYGRDADLLRLVTPGFGDCLQYIQFIALTGALSLDYPGYYQPAVSQVGWSALMFNESLVSHSPPWQSVVDGIYVTNATDGYGLHELGQLIGMAESTDIWASMMAWLCVIIVGVFVLFQAGFLVQWVWRRINNISEEDLRAKNIPFSIGNVVRIVFNYMLMPIVALSTFQLVIAGNSPPYTVALAVVTLVLLLGCAIWILLIILRTRPKSVLFDDLPTVLRYGPLYNTYSDEVAAFALIPAMLNFIRGIAIGAVQPSGVAQVVLLAICEVIQIFTLHAFRPFNRPTSMNAYHTLFASLRAVTIMLMVAFVPSLGVTEGPKGWIGYAILLIHAAVLIFAFFLGALQTVVEVVARMLGAGGDDVTGLTRGGLSKIFGMRQLSRRETSRTRAGPSRASQLSTAAMLDAEEGGRVGYVMPSGRVRSGSGASLGGMGGRHRHRSSSALDSIDMYSGSPRHVDTGSSYIPGTPGETSTFSFVAGPNLARQPVPAGTEATDPYYRPPRRTRRDTLRESTYSDKAPELLDPKKAAQAATASGDVTETGEEISRAATPAPPNPTMNLPANRPDYATREVDFYYGVRGPALNSEGPGRKLGTGPADPTGPVATATGWFRNMFSGKTKEKGKGFEVVRSKRMPASMVRNGGFGDETPPEGIPVAMGVLRNGPIESDDDEPKAKNSPKRSPKRPGDLLTDSGDPQLSDPDEPVSPVEERQGRSQQPAADASRVSSLDEDDLALPAIPRKSSKRNSGSVDRHRLSALSLVESVPHGETASHAASDNDPEPESVGSARAYRLAPLPFERTTSQRRPSSNSSLEFSSAFVDVDLQGRQDERPASLGTVPHHEISRHDPQPASTNLASSAELVNDSASSRRRS